MSTLYLEELRDQVKLDDLSVSISERRAVFKTRQAFERVSDYTRSCPTSPSAGRVYRKNLGWNPDTPDNWWFFVVQDDPTDPEVRLHHPYRPIFRDEESSMGDPYVDSDDEVSQGKLILDIPMDRHPSVKHFAPLFDARHLPPHLQIAAIPIIVAAQALVDLCHDNPELSAALRKLLEAKDCAVRALLLDDHLGAIVGGRTED